MTIAATLGVLFGRAKARPYDSRAEAGVSPRRLYMRSGSGGRPDRSPLRFSPEKMLGIYVLSQRFAIGANLYCCQLVKEGQDSFWKREVHDYSCNS